MERICERCGIHVVIPKSEDLRICPKCKGLLVDDTFADEVNCRHKVNEICELGIKTWCANCKKQKWGKYGPREDT